MSATLSKGLAGIFREVRNQPVESDLWLVLADGLEEEGRPRLARRITRHVWRARRLARARRAAPAEPEKWSPRLPLREERGRIPRYLARIRLSNKTDSDHRHLMWALEDAFGFA